MGLFKIWDFVKPAEVPDSCPQTRVSSKRAATVLFINSTFVYQMDKNN